jgi:hypothetical protein
VTSWLNFAEYLPVERPVNNFPEYPPTIPPSYNPYMNYNGQQVAPQQGGGGFVDPYNPFNFFSMRSEQGADVEGDVEEAGER